MYKTVFILKIFLIFIFYFSRIYAIPYQIEGPYLVEKENSIHLRKLSICMKEINGKYYVAFESGSIEKGSNFIKIKQSDSQGIYFKKDTVIPSIDGIRRVPVDFLYENKQFKYLIYSEIELEVYDYLQDQTKFNKNKFTRLYKLNINDFRKTKLLKESSSEPLVTSLYTEFMDVQSLNKVNNSVLPYWELESKEDSKYFSSFPGVLIYDLVNNKQLKQSRINYEENLYEPSVVVLKNTFFMTLRSNSGYILYTISSDGGQNWSYPKPLSLVSPSSINKAILWNDEIIIVFNNIKPSKLGDQGPRNSLDMAILDSTTFQVKKIINLVHDKNDFFSNFDLVIGSDNSLRVVYQRLLRKIKHQPDRIELIIVHNRNKKDLD